MYIYICVYIYNIYIYIILVTSSDTIRFSSSCFTCPSCRGSDMPYNSWMSKPNDPKYSKVSTRIGAAPGLNCAAVL